MMKLRFDFTASIWRLILLTHCILIQRLARTLKKFLISLIGSSFLLLSHLFDHQLSCSLSKTSEFLNPFIKWITLQHWAILLSLSVCFALFMIEFVGLWWCLSFYCFMRTWAWVGWIRLCIGIGRWLVRRQDGSLLIFVHLAQLSYP